MKKKFRIILLILLVTIMVTSILYLIDYYRKTNNDNEIFKSLEQENDKNESEASSFEEDPELSNNVENNQIDNSSSNRQNSTLRLKANSYSNFDLKSLKIKMETLRGGLKLMEQE